MRPTVVEDQQMTIRQNARGVLRVESSERIVEKGELVVSAAEHPRQRMRPAIDLDDGAQISKGHDDLPVQIKIDGVGVVQIGEDSRRNVVAHTPVLESGDQRVDSSGNFYSEYLVDGDGIRGTTTDGRAIERAKVVAE